VKPSPSKEADILQLIAAGRMIPRSSDIVRVFWSNDMEGMCCDVSNPKFLGRSFRLQHRPGRSRNAAICSLQPQTYRGIA
jgi:hypothetical protein